MEVTQPTEQPRGLGSKGVRPTAHEDLNLLPITQASLSGDPGLLGLSDETAAPVHIAAPLRP